MPFLLSDGPFSNTLFGFDDAGLERDFQASYAHEARRLDLAANISFLLLMLCVISRLASSSTSASELAIVVLGTVGIHGLWAWVATWQKGPAKAVWRTRLLIAQRLHNISCGVVCDRVILFPYMREASLPYMVHNLLTASRVLVFLILILGMRLPFKRHVPTQLLSTAAFTALNLRLCRQCSLGMQAEFARLARLFSRVAAGSALLTPQLRPASVRDSHACFAVNELVMVTCATLLPSAILWFLETKSRMEFLHRSGRLESAAGGPAHPRPSARELPALIDEQLCKAAGVSVFPVAVVVGALPAASLLWNLHIVVDKLLHL